MELIKEYYPTAAKVEQLFKEFHSILMEADATKLDGYLDKYGESQIKPFCNAISGLFETI